MTDVAEIEPVEQPLEEEEPSMIEKEEKIAEIVDPGEVGFLRKGFNQNIIAGIVAFTGPGLFNVLQGLGNAGGSDPKVAATMNATLYATFSIFGILSGSLFNLLGTFAKRRKKKRVCVFALTFTLGMLKTNFSFHPTPQK